MKKVDSSKIKLKIMLLIIAILTTMTGCNPFSQRDLYTGEYPDLFTVVMNSIPGQKGHLGGAQPYLRVIATDDYGRTLFLYFEGSVISSYNLVISQKTEGDVVYFYPHYNFISFQDIFYWFDFQEGNLIFEDAEVPYVVHGSNNEREVRYRLTPAPFSELEINEFKARNSWNQPLDLGNAIRAEVTRNKEAGSVCNNILIDAYNTAFGDDALGRPLNRIVYFTSDGYGRSIYTGWGRWDGENRTHIVLLFQLDATFEFMILFDPQNYQDELKEFKVNNNWNKP